jgi:hypothetical protein
MREVEARRFAVPLARLEALCALAGPLAEPTASYTRLVRRGRSK